MANGGKNHEHDEHPDCSKYQGLATTEVFHDIQASKGGGEVNSAKDALGDEAVRETSACKDSGSLYSS
jgi:hypothetical protein